MNGAHLEDDTMSEGRHSHENNYFRDWNHHHETRGDYAPVVPPPPEPRRADLYMTERDATELAVAARGRELHGPYEGYSQYSHPERYYEDALFSRDAASIGRLEEERSRSFFPHQSSPTLMV